MKLTREILEPLLRAHSECKAGRRCHEAEERLGRVSDFIMDGLGRMVLQQDAEDDAKFNDFLNTFEEEELDVGKTAQVLLEKAESDVRLPAPKFFTEEEKARMRKTPGAYSFRTVKVKRSEYAETRRTLRDCVNELCLKCGSYHERYTGACNGCRWKKVQEDTRCV